MSRIFKFRENLTGVSSTLHEDVGTFMIISGQIHLRMRDVSDRVGEKIITDILCSITFLFPKIVPFEIMQKKQVLEPDRTQMAI